MCDIQIFSRHALITREVLKWYYDIEMCLRFNKIHAVRGNEEEKVSYIFAFQNMKRLRFIRPRVQKEQLIPKPHVCFI